MFQEPTSRLSCTTEHTAGNVLAYVSAAFLKWRGPDSNRRPRGYEGKGQTTTSAQETLWLKGLREAYRRRQLLQTISLYIKPSRKNWDIQFCPVSKPGQPGRDFDREKVRED